MVFDGAEKLKEIRQALIDAGEGMLDEVSVKLFGKKWTTMSKGERRVSLQGQGATQLMSGIKKRLAKGHSVKAKLRFWELQKTEGYVSPTRRARYSDTLDELRGFIPEDTKIPKVLIEDQARSDSLGIYSTGNNKIEIKPSHLQSTRSTIAHEYTHHIVAHSRNVKRITLEHWRHRTENEVAKRLSRWGNRVTDKFKLDKWYSEYTGRLYKTRGGEELLTTHVETLFDTTAFKACLLKDPETFSFMTGILDGKVMAL